VTADVEGDDAEIIDAEIIDAAGVETARLTIAEASQATGLHARTIRRGIQRGAYPSAVMIDGAWHLTAADLIAAGHDLAAPPAEDVVEAPPAEIAEIARLRAEVEELRRRAEVAEAIAAAQDRSLQMLNLALRALPAGPAEAPTDRRRWGRRRR